VLVDPEPDVEPELVDPLLPIDPLLPMDPLLLEPLWLFLCFLCLVVVCPD
jgi:hypothetical protein